MNFGMQKPAAAAPAVAVKSMTTAPGPPPVATKSLTTAPDRALVATDIRVAAALADRVARWWPNIHTRALTAIVAEFAKRIDDEMDFRIEAANLLAVRANFARNPRITVPAIVEDLSGRDMEREAAEGRRG